MQRLPVLGGAQIIAFAGLIETTGFFQAASTTDGRGPREGQFSMKDSTETGEPGNYGVGFPTFLGKAASTTDGRGPREGQFSMKDSTETGEPGNYGVGFPTFLGKVEDPEVRKSKLAAELANGRLAMMAIIGMFFQDGLTGSAWGDWSLYTASPLRAEEAEEPPKPPPFDPAKQVGAMEPLGYFDPAGFCKVGDKEGFQNLRAAEIKHGRVAMMAALGAVAQHYIKFPGFDAGWQGRESVPAGVGAVTTAPGTYGFAALFLLSGAMELAVWTQDPNKEAGDFGDPLGLGQYNEEFRNKELNNGRFAMFAAIGIISADLLTGKDAIQQPKLEARPTHQKKNSFHAHDGGVVTMFKSIPEEQQWAQVKAAVQEKLPPKVSLWHVGQVNDKHECAMVCAPFDGDMTFFENLSIELGGSTLKCEVCFGDVLQKALKEMPKHIRDKRERESRKRQKERNRPIKLGTCHFNNVAMLRGRVKALAAQAPTAARLKPCVSSPLGVRPRGPLPQRFPPFFGAPAPRGGGSRAASRS
eukprot:s392_g36.t1